MRKLVETDGLGHTHAQILCTLTDIGDVEVRRAIHELDGAKVRADKIVVRLKELGLFGCAIDERYRAGSEASLPASWSQLGPTYQAVGM